MPLLDIYKNLPVEVVDADGLIIEDISGRKFVDLTGGLGVHILGYNSSDINRVIRESKEPLHISNLFIDPLKEKVAARLEAMTGMDRTFFTNSGTEAVEAGIKFAWKSSQGKILILEGSFHGRTLGSWSISDILKNQEFPSIGAEIVTVSFNDPEFLLKASEDASIFIYEPVQGSGGVRVLSKEMASAIKEIQKRGVIIIADEIQSGLSRTGKFLASEWFGLEPDIVLLGKGLGGGLPLGAVLMKEEVAENIKKGEHGSTMGGNHLALRLCECILDRLTGGLTERVKEIGEYIFEQYGTGFSLRGKGLFIGINTNKEGMDRKLMERGFLVSIVRENVIRLLPPYIVDIETVDRFFDVLMEICLESG